MLTLNSLLDRAGSFRNFFSGGRDLYGVLGYKHNPTIQDYLYMYKRQDIAKKVVDTYPNATWASKPSVINDDGTQKVTLLEDEVHILMTKHKVLHHLNRLDILSGIGRFGILLIGIRDGKRLDTPAMPVKNGMDDLLFLMSFGESSVRIEKYNVDPYSPDYGKPLLYAVTTGGYEGMPIKTMQVHSSRVIHVAEGLLDNNIFGAPRLECVYNRLVDLEKVVGGASEIFWLNARAGLSVNAAKDAVVNDAEEMKSHVKDYMDNLSRFILTKGMEVKTLEMSVASPADHVSIILDLVSGATGIPKRILVGSERGELASSQDERNFKDKVNYRRITYCEPTILRPFLDKLIWLQIIPDVMNYKIEWGSLSYPTQQEISAHALSISQAIATYANSIGGENLIPHRQFVEEVLQMDYRADDINDTMIAEEDAQIDEEQKILDQEQGTVSNDE